MKKNRRKIWLKGKKEQKRILRKKSRKRNGWSRSLSKGEKVERNKETKRGMTES